MPADIVVRSSPDDTYHCCAALVPGAPELVEALDVARSQPVTVRGVTFQAFATTESPTYKGERAGENAIYAFRLGGLGILHLGDIGIPLPAEYAERLRDEVDVLLAPVGAGPTIALDDLDRAIAALRPRVIIPMHYAIPKLISRIPLLPVEPFARRYPRDAVVRTDSAQVSFAPDSLPERLSIYVLRPAG